MMINNNGQSLFEVLVAVALAAIIVTSIASVATISLSNSEFARTNSEARQVMQNLLEDARKFRDTNPDCIKDENCNNTVSCSAPFSCTLTIIYNDSNSDGTSDSANVTATVVWTDGRGEHSASSQTILTAWQD